MRFGLFYLLLAAAVWPLPAADAVVGGPMAVNVGPRTATIVWIVQSSEVALKGGGEERKAPALRVEKTTFTGLKSGVSYDYTVPGHDELKGSFKTAPAPASTEPFELSRPI